MLSFGRRVTIALWKLSTCKFVRTVAKTFAAGKSTAVQFTREFCFKMLYLAPWFIYFHRVRREKTEAVEQFLFRQCRTPQIIGALESKHIPIVSHNVDGKADYFSRKQCYTISIQGLLVFLDVATEFP